MSTLGPLQDGGRVAIIGGGPGGIGCALALHHLSRQMGRRLTISVIEGKEFAGERHHNICVGVLSNPLPAVMTECLDLPFPHHLVQADVAGYVLHTAKEQIRLEDVHRASVTIRRIEFDHYMLEAARARGIHIEQSRATDVNFHDDGVTVYTESEPIEADVVVGAFGMDDGSAATFSRTTPYRPPKALISMLTKYEPGAPVMTTFDSYVHAFLPQSSEIEFGAITPKAGYVTINIAGLAVDRPAMRRFLALPVVRSLLPGLADPDFDFEHARIFKGRFPRSLAQNYYGDRYVMVGDAAGLVRAFKGKGVTSAVQTSVRAAQTILESGISHAAFAGQYRAANRDITDDALPGTFVRYVVTLSARFGLIDPVVRAARYDVPVAHALFGAVSAHESYSHILREMVNYRSVLAVLRATIP